MSELEKCALLYLTEISLEGFIKARCGVKGFVNFSLPIISEGKSNCAFLLFNSSFNWALRFRVTEREDGQHRASEIMIYARSFIENCSYMCLLFWGLSARLQQSLYLIEAKLRRKRKSALFCLFFLMRAWITVSRYLQSLAERPACPQHEGFTLSSLCAPVRAM